MKIDVSELFGYSIHVVWYDSEDVHHLRDFDSMPAAQAFACRLASDFESPCNFVQVQLTLDY